MVELAKVLVDARVSLLEIVEFFPLDIIDTLWHISSSKSFCKFYPNNVSGISVSGTIILPPVGGGSSELMCSIQSLLSRRALHKV